MLLSHSQNTHSCVVLPVLLLLELHHIEWYPCAVDFVSDRNSVFEHRSVHICCQEAKSQTLYSIFTRTGWKTRIPFCRKFQDFNNCFHLALEQNPRHLKKNHEKLEWALLPHNDQVVMMLSWAARDPHSSPCSSWAGLWVSFNSSLTWETDMFCKKKFCFWQISLFPQKILNQF